MIALTIGNIHSFASTSYFFLEVSQITAMANYLSTIQRNATIICSMGVHTAQIDNIKMLFQSNGIKNAKLNSSTGLSEEGARTSS